MMTKRNNKKELIIDRAIAIVVNEGFDGLSMHKLAKAADLSVATIYIYFKSKEVLLNHLFNHVQVLFRNVFFAGFSTGLNFEEGLWLLWKNHFYFINNHAVKFNFFEQFQNSYLINHSAIETTDVRNVIEDFARQAIANKEIQQMDGETFWALAFGPFYQLMKFHLHRNLKENQHYSVTEQKLKLVFKMTVNALKIQADNESKC